jgi:hypothetical protein
MYATRARSIINHSEINRSVTGNTTMYAVTSEIDRLRRSLGDRSLEVERLLTEHKAHQLEAQTVSRSKDRAWEVKMRGLQADSVREKAMLEKQLATVVSNHSRMTCMTQEHERELVQLRTVVQRMEDEKATATATATAINRQSQPEISVHGEIDVAKGEGEIDVADAAEFLQQVKELHAMNYILYTIHYTLYTILYPILYPRTATVGLGKGAGYN